MKTTGMVRRIDELGRIVIPKEMRKQLMMKEGESISFSLENDKIVLTKFSMLNKLGPTIQVLLDGLYKKYRNTFMLCDLQQVLACSADGLRYQRKPLSKELILKLESQTKEIEGIYEWLDMTEKVTCIPLVYEQVCKGAIIMLTKQTPYHMMDEELLNFVKVVIEQEMEACV